MSSASPVRAAVAVIATILVTACGAAVHSPSAAPASSGGPSAPAVLGRDWQRVESVGAPAGNTDVTPAPYENPGGLGHPMVYEGGQADIVDVVPNGRGFVAVGFLETAAGPKASAWSSPDGRTWTLVADFPTADPSVIRAVAADAHGFVAVGAEGSHAAAWYSADGRAWQRSASAALAESRGVELDAVLATPTGYVAAGADGALGTETHAAFWRSAEGRDWDRLPDGSDAAAARVEGLASGVGGLVAVGTAVHGTAPSGAAIWTSTDGATWRRAPDSADTRIGPMHAVTAGPGAYLAIGTNLAGTRAVAWSSPDGLAWRAAPDADALDNHGLQIEMRDVARAGDVFIAVGHLLFGTQYPSGVIWSSPDGKAWTRAPDVASFQQARILGVTAGEREAVAVGTFGSPDFAIPVVWVSPPRP